TFATRTTGGDVGCGVVAGPRAGTHTEPLVPARAPARGRGQRHGVEDLEHLLRHFGTDDEAPVRALQGRIVVLQELADARERDVRSISRIDGLDVFVGE